MRQLHAEGTCNSHMMRADAAIPASVTVVLCSITGKTRIIYLTSDRSSFILQMLA